MAQSVTLNGSSFSIPDVGENDWGQNVTDFLVAIPGAVLQKSGGSFTLTAEVDFGGSFGLKSLYYKSRAANPASAGAIRLGVADVVSWRNNANGANLDLGVDAADALIYGANKVVTVAGGFTFVATNIYANQKGIRFMEQTGNGSNYIELVAPDAVTASVTLKLPDGVGTSGQVLSTDGAGVLSWIAAAGGGTVNTGTQGRLALYSSTGTTLDDVVTMTNTVSLAIASHGQGSVYTIPDTGSATANFVMTAGAQTIGGTKTFSGSLVLSNTVADVLSITANNTMKVDSSNVLVSIGTATMTHPLHIQKSVTGAATVLALENTESANAASHAQIQIITAGASAGDPFVTLNNGVQVYSIGIDNSDSDALCITGASTLNGTNLFRMTTTGAVTHAGAVTITPTSNQLVLGVTNTTTISATAPSASRVYTMPDVGGAADFVMTAGTQSIAGAKTFTTSPLAISTAGDSYFRAITSSNGNVAGLRLTNSATDAYVAMETASDAGGGAFTGCGASALVLYHGSSFPICLVTNDVKRLEITGAGAMNYGFANSGASNTFTIDHPTNAASSDARLQITVAGSSGGDPVIGMTVTGGESWTLGPDNSNGDRFKICSSATMGTSAALTITAAGADATFGFGTEDPGAYNTNANKAVFRNASGNVGITLSSTTNGACFIAAQDTENTTIPGLITYDHDVTASNEYWEFRSGGTDSVIRIFSTVMLSALTTKTYDQGTASLAFDDIYADDFQNVADIEFMDFIKTKDGKVVELNDRELIQKIQPKKDKDGNVIFNAQGHAFWDDDTAPQWLFTEDKRNPGNLVRDDEGRPWVSVRKLSALALGAIGQMGKEFDGLTVRVQSVEEKITDLTQRLETLEKAA